jgi:hypothetical protein
MAPKQAFKPTASGLALRKITHAFAASAADTEDRPKRLYRL